MASVQKFLFGKSKTKKAGCGQIEIDQIIGLDYMLEVFRFLYVKCEKEKLSNAERLLIKRIGKGNLKNIHVWEPKPEHGYYIEHDVGLEFIKQFPY